MVTKVKVIAFDLGSNMAWAFSMGRKIGTGRAVYKGVRPQRLADLARDLTNILNGKYRYDILVYETPFVRGRDATRALWGIAGILEAAATTAGMAVTDVAVPTIKKFATGHGFAAKVEMMEAAKRFGYQGMDEHEADAVCLLRYAEENLERVVGGGK